MRHASTLDLPPIVHVTGGTIAAGRPFVTSGSFDDPNAPPDATYSAAVNFGEGTGYLRLNLLASNTFALNHVYASKGRYVITVVVADDGGATGSATAMVNVHASSGPSELGGRSGQPQE